MPKIDLNEVPVTTGSSYPKPYDQMFAGRRQLRLGQASGLTQFGANLVRLAPGAMSSLRHWHEQQDEFLMVTEGVLTLVDDKGDTEMRPGDCAAFPAGDPNGHHMVNRSDSIGAFLVVGTHTPTETGWYSDIDMKVESQGGNFHFTRKDGGALKPMAEIFEPIGENLTRALISGDFALYETLFELPTTITGRDGTSYVIRDRAALEKDFALYRHMIRMHSLTDIVRDIQSREFLDGGTRKRVTAKVHLLSGAQLVMDPVLSHFWLHDGPDGWRITSIESSRDHINWTLGLDQTTPQASPETE
ncbi:cupin domain-containing protein [Tropicibacter oceani]|uniref:cupin domain-containing protein n=1 Tax=Tropicibacter oceani TaxID=3058420 RepID=UPI002938D901|nr:cupin domain-containing protein [Tropicibacter oceani]